jgi:hypothetical protein
MEFEEFYAKMLAAGYGDDEIAAAWDAGVDLVDDPQALEKIRAQIAFLKGERKKPS